MLDLGYGKNKSYLTRFRLPSLDPVQIFLTNSHLHKATKYFNAERYPRFTRPQERNGSFQVSLQQGLMMASELSPHLGTRKDGNWRDVAVA
jgi:hypothetical protein